MNKAQASHVKALVAWIIEDKQALIEALVARGY